MAKRTCFVGCKLTMTSLPPCFLVANGKLPLGTICSVVPKHIFKSATLKQNQDHYLKISSRETPDVYFDWYSDISRSSSGKLSSQSKIVSCSCPLHILPFRWCRQHFEPSSFFPTVVVADRRINCLLANHCFTFRRQLHVFQFTFHKCYIVLRTCFHAIRQ